MNKSENTRIIETPESIYEQFPNGMMAYVGRGKKAAMEDMLKYFVAASRKECGCTVQPLRKN